MEIRRITPEDDALLAALIRRILKGYGLDIPGTAYFDPELERLSAHYAEKPDARAYFVACENGEVIGGAGFSEFPEKESCAELQKLYVDERYRGRGVGRTLFKYICEEAARSGYALLYLETHSSLKEAVSLYESEGFERVERPAHAVHSTMDVFMIKKA